MTYCWTIIAEQKGRKSIADNGFLTYEEADHFRLELKRRHPNVDYFVASEARFSKPQRALAHARRGFGGWDWRLTFEAG
jgi:hypothetical protein